MANSARLSRSQGTAALGWRSAEGRDPMTRTAYVIAFRRDRSGARAANLAAVIEHVSALPNVEIVVVEQDTGSTFDAPAGVKYHFIAHDGPFNKSWAMNVGFRLTDAPVVGFGDADLIVSLPEMTAAINAVAAGDFDAVKPFDRIVDLSEQETAAFREGGPLPDPTTDLEGNKRGQGEYLPFCGGLFFVTRELFARAGGYDERFSGWGGEDDALSVKFARLGGKLGINAQRACYHLWHERGAARYTHASYGANVDRLTFLQQCTDAELRKICDADAAEMGNPRAPIQGP